jgi:RNA polymerase sigma-70 factor (ECF subfamily)
LAVRRGLIEPGLAGTFRDEWGRTVAALIHRFGDWDLAEDCAQEAFALASERWPVEGTPSRPGAWLFTVARNRAIDRLRRTATYQAKLSAVATMATALAGGEDAALAPPPDKPEALDEGSFPDKRLGLIFTCCHPALAMEARVALTLRTLAGLSTAEIARAFLVPEATMAKRLVRAKHKIQNAGIPCRVPPVSALAGRAAGVLAVLYLLFNEGYSASAGDDLVRRDLCDEAIRLARVLAGLMPELSEAKGLLALMLVHQARRASRVDGNGDLVRLEDQDRSLWDRAAIKEGERLLAEAARRGEAGPYQLQATIASCHAGAATAGATDWHRIAQLYQRLAELTGSPVVDLNRSVAVAMAYGPEVGLAIVQQLEGSGVLGDYYLVPATKADFLRRLGRCREAATAYREALALARNEPERRFLEGRLAEVVSQSLGTGGGAEGL